MRHLRAVLLRQSLVLLDVGSVTSHRYFKDAQQYVCSGKVCYIVEPLTQRNSDSFLQLRDANPIATRSHTHGEKTGKLLLVERARQRL
jgi:hypothetical protein